MYAHLCLAAEPTRSCPVVLPLPVTASLLAFAPMSSWLPSRASQNDKKRAESTILNNAQGKRCKWSEILEAFIHSNCSSCTAQQGWSSYKTDWRRRSPIQNVRHMVGRLLCMCQTNTWIRGWGKLKTGSWSGVEMREQEKPFQLLQFLERPAWLTLLP